MESLYKLSEAVKGFEKDLKAISSKVSSEEGNIEGLTAKKAALTSECEDLSNKKAQLIEFLGQTESNLKKEYEAKMRELAVKSDQLDGQRGQVKSKEIQAEIAIKDAAESKAKFDALYSEYEGKIAEINQKREAVLNALK